MGIQGLAFSRGVCYTDGFNGELASSSLGLVRILIRFVVYNVHIYISIMRPLFVSS